MFAPVSSCADDEAVAERFFAGCGKEAVDVGFLQAVVFCIQLALDGVVLAGVRDGNQINAGIPCILLLLLCSVSVHQYLAVEIAVAGFMTQIAQDQFFKISTFFAFGSRSMAIGIQQGFQC